jgi:hypothetical protein
VEAGQCTPSAPAENVAAAAYACTVGSCDDSSGISARMPATGRSAAAHSSAPPGQLRRLGEGKTRTVQHQVGDGAGSTPLHIQDGNAG